MTKLPCQFSVASDAASCSTPHIEIVSRKRMITWAVSFEGVDCGDCFTSKEIGSLSNCFKVIWSNAEADPTTMIDLKSVRYGPDQESVGVAVGIHQASVNVQASVASSVRSPQPHPVIFSLLDLAPESGRGIRSHVHSGRHASMVPGVMT